MKKITLLMAVVLLVSMLGGCYKADTVFDFNMTGGVEVTSTMLASKEMYDVIGLANPDELVSTYAPETIEMYASMYGAEEKGERIELVPVAADGTVLPEGTALPEDGSMVGTRLKMRYGSLRDALSSFTLMNYLRPLPLSQSAEGYGLKLEEKNTLYGTKYIASGKISVFVDETHKAEYDGGEDQAVKDKITEASNAVTFKFPLAFSKSNADEKGFLGSSLKWTVDNNTQEKDVYFEVTVFNPLVLGMALLILILLVIILILALKKRGGADAYFVDAEGNPIPVYDSEDDEEEAEIAFEEVTEGELPQSVSPETEGKTDAITGSEEETTEE